MSGVQVTDAAVAAAVDKAQWSWDAEDGLPSPEDTMRPILAAAASHLTDERVTAALALHSPTCGRCYSPIPDCTCATDDWREPEDRNPIPECHTCLLSFSMEEYQPWPCPTARALGAAEDTGGAS